MLSRAKVREEFDETKGPTLQLRRRKKTTAVVGDCFSGSGSKDGSRAESDAERGGKRMAEGSESGARRGDARESYGATISDDVEEVIISSTSTSFLVSVPTTTLISVASTLPIPTLSSPVLSTHAFLTLTSSVPASSSSVMRSSLGKSLSSLRSQLANQRPLVAPKQKKKLKTTATKVTCPLGTSSATTSNTMTSTF
ncbi:hypothetical protein J1N35_012439 [Gossypium stocksii]|uniref:Uncharacterized protein n=1 Tax=Gossypium stocksii TaxID=47602 RepID=A0A9D3W4B0_9ROSI|nr:hypothetical protein J1N35_012439 [Gossypium stocksii]